MSSTNSLRPNSKPQTRLVTLARNASNAQKNAQPGQAAHPPAQTPLATRIAKHLAATASRVAASIRHAAQGAAEAIRAPIQLLQLRALGGGQVVMDDEPAGGRAPDPLTRATGGVDQQVLRNAADHLLNGSGAPAREPSTTSHSESDPLVSSEEGWFRPITELPSGPVTLVPVPSDAPPPADAPPAPVIVNTWSAVVAASADDIRKALASPTTAFRSNDAGSQARQAFLKQEWPDFKTACQGLLSNVLDGQGNSDVVKMALPRIVGQGSRDSFDNLSAQYKIAEQCLDGLVGLINQAPPSIRSFLSEARATIEAEARAATPNDDEAAIRARTDGLTQKLFSDLFILRGVSPLIATHYASDAGASDEHRQMVKKVGGHITRLFGGVEAARSNAAQNGAVDGNGDFEVATADQVKVAYDNFTQRAQQHLGRINLIQRPGG